LRRCRWCTGATADSVRRLALQSKPLGYADDTISHWTELPEPERNQFFPRSPDGGRKLLSGRCCSRFAVPSARAPVQRVERKFRLCKSAVSERRSSTGKPAVRLPDREGLPIRLFQSGELRNRT